jgi:KTSC domain
MQKVLQFAIGTALLMAAQVAMAERVYVKSRGEVDLAPFRCASLTRSANVKRLCYDEREMYVLVSLKGIWYHFCGVPPSTVSAWKKASAPGRYYNEYVREKFDCQATPAPMYR